MGLLKVRTVMHAVLWDKCLSRVDGATRRSYTSRKHPRGHELCAEAAGAAGSLGLAKQQPWVSVAVGKKCPPYNLSSASACAVSGQLIQQADSWNLGAWAWVHMTERTDLWFVDIITQTPAVRVHIIAGYPDAGHQGQGNGWVWCRSDGVCSLLFRDLACS